MMSPSQVKADLLALRSIRALLRSPAFPFPLQLLALVGVLALAANGLGIGGGASTAP